MQLADAGMLPDGDSLVIGLNPPFGKNNQLARRFVEHAAIFHPRVIVLIVPPGTPIPDGYIVMYEDQTTMHDRWRPHCPLLMLQPFVLFLDCFV